MKYVYIIRKYIEAKSLKEAVKLDKKTEPHDVWLTDESSKELQEAILKKKKSVGFKSKKK